MRVKEIAAFAALSTVLVAGGAVAAEGSFGERINSGSTSAQEQRAEKEAILPQCDHAMGSVAIVAPEKNWWNGAKLQSPDALIKMFVTKSGCFTVVDRGRGFDVAERERALASGGNLQKGSNIGGGQMRAADYVITPDIVANNENSGGSAIGAILGSFIPYVGIIASQISMSDKSAEVTLSVTDVRTSEQVIMAEGKAAKTDIGFGVAGGAFVGGGFGAAGLGSYENTALGQVVALAYLEAYVKMVDRIRTLQPTATIPVAETPSREVPTATASLQPTAVSNADSVTMARSGYLFKGPSVRSGQVSELSPGTILYPTAKKSGTWWEVTDDSGITGWVSSQMLKLGHP